MKLLADLGNSGHVVISRKALMLADVLFKIVQLLKSVLDLIIDLMFDNH